MRQALNVSERQPLPKGCIERRFPETDYLMQQEV